MSAFFGTDGGANPNLTAMTNVEWLPLGVFTSPARSGGLASGSSLDELLKQAPAATIVTPAGRQPHSLVLVPAK